MLQGNLVACLSTASLVAPHPGLGQYPRNSHPLTILINLDQVFSGQVKNTWKIYAKLCVGSEGRVYVDFSGERGYNYQHILDGKYDPQRY